MRWQYCAAAVLLGWALSAVQPAAGQEQVDEVDGVCDESVRNGCSAGIPNDAAFPNFPPVYVWRCDGLNGGANSSKCALRVSEVPVDGVCDETVRNGCAAGTPNDEVFPDYSTIYVWRCDGQHGGSNSEKCVKYTAVDGGWSDWSACSASACGEAGTQTRTCDNPAPEHAGQACLNQRHADAGLQQPDAGVRRQRMRWRDVALLHGRQREGWRLGDRRVGRVERLHWLNLQQEQKPLRHLHTGRLRRHGLLRRRHQAGANADGGVPKSCLGCGRVERLERLQRDRVRRGRPADPDPDGHLPMRQHLPHTQAGHVGNPRLHGKQSEGWRVADWRLGPVDRLQSVHMQDEQVTICHVCISRLWREGMQPGR